MAVCRYWTAVRATSSFGIVIVETSRLLPVRVEESSG